MKYHFKYDIVGIEYGDIHISGSEMKHGCSKESDVDVGAVALVSLVQMKTQEHETRYPLKASYVQVLLFTGSNSQQRDRILIRKRRMDR